MQVRSSPAVARGKLVATLGALAVLAGCASSGPPERFALDRTMRGCLANAGAGASADARQAGGRERGQVRALVVGANYSGATDEFGSANLDLALPNTLNDACLVDAAFGDLPHAHSSFVANPTADTLQSALDGFVASVGENDTVVFYFSGHGVQADGRNYFLMNDGRWAVPVDDVLDALVQRSKFVVFIVDACRIPVLGGGAQAAPAFMPAAAARPGALSRVAVESLTFGGRGLAQLGRARGTKAVVQFSTEPGNTAWDGEAGSFSPFARAIYHEIGERASFEEVSRRIQNRVACEIEMWENIRGFRRCTDSSFARDTAGAVAERLAVETAGGALPSKAAQFPWRQGDVGEPIYLAGEPRFPVP